MSVQTSQDYLLLALSLAECGRFSVSPNPMVGCVIVKDGQIIGKGYHERAGEAHAEIHALGEAGDNAKDATLYLTLEPCCHFGRTPPCTKAIIKAGVKKVVVATLDPNPLMSGKGLKELVDAGIEVEVGICEEAAQKLNQIYFHFIKHQRPFVIAKWAMSLDGKTITHPDDERHISSIKTQQSAHALRQQVDAILIGSKTAIADDPQLTVRYSSSPIQKHPVRIILSTNGTLPLSLKLFSGEIPGKTIVATTKPLDPNHQKIFSQKNIEVLLLPENKLGQVDLHALLIELGNRQITSLLVEGGMTTHESFFNENLINQTHVYIAPVIIGKREKKIKLIGTKLNILPSDFYFCSSLEESDHV